MTHPEPNETRAVVGSRPFLTAEWRLLLMANWRVGPKLLQPHVPKGTTLDRWQGTTYVSLVAFLFHDTRLRGVPIPFHRNFEEVNLRFYIRRESSGEPRRGVVFIKEIVSRPAITFVARWCYNENYITLPTDHEVVWNDEPSADLGRLSYSWGRGDGPYRMAAQVNGTPSVLRAETEEEFITEHFWGYAKQRDGGTLEYRVAHPRWRVWSTKDLDLTGDFAALYGNDLGTVLSQEPKSVFVAEGSPVQVYPGRRLENVFAGS